MANPNSLLNGQGQALDLLAGADGTALLKLAVGNKTVAGATSDGGWQGVATHADGAAFVASDGVVLISGVESGATTLRRLLTDATGRLLVSEGAGAATRTSVSAAAADTLILAANTSRRGATVYNDSSAILYLGLGTTAASTTNFTVPLTAGTFYEIPYGFSGQIRGIWASATGSARVTELT